MKLCRSGFFVIFGAAMLSASLFLAGCDQVQLSAFELVQRAQESAERGDLKSAVIDLKGALLESPDNLEARVLLGEYYLELGDSVGAVKELMRAEKLGVPRGELMLSLAKAQLLAGDARAVVLTLAPEEARSNNERFDVLMLRGDAFQALGQLDPARNSYMAALALKPGDIGPIKGIAKIEVLGRDDEAAAGALETWRQFDAEDPKQWLLAAYDHQQQGSLFQAKEAYKKAVELEPENANAKIELAWSLFYLGKNSASKKLVADLKSADTARTRAVILRAALAFSDGDVRRAREIMEPISDRLDSDVQAMLLMASIYHMEGENESALTIAKKVLIKFPENPGLQFLVASIYAHLGSDEKALEALKNIKALQVGAVDLESLVRNLADSDFRLPGAAEASGTEAANLGNDGFHQKAQGVASTDGSEDELAGLLSLVRSKQYEQARARAEELLKGRPDDVLLLNLLGVSRLNTGMTAEAEQAWRHALEIRPADPSANASMAALELREGNAEGALARYLFVLEAHSDHVQTLLVAAELERRLGLKAEALAHLEKALEVDPLRREVRVALAEMLLSEGKSKEAYHIILPAMDFSGRDPRVLMVLGSAQFALGKSKSALESFGRLTAVLPDSSKAWFLLAQAQGAMNLKSEMADSLRTVLRLQPDHERAKLALARILVGEENIDELRPLVEELVRSNPEVADVLFLKGWVAEKDGRLADALLAYQEGLEKAPESSQLLLKVALVLLRTKHPEEAVTLMEGWVQQHPDNVQVRITLASTQLMLGIPDKAIEGFEQVLAIEPGNILASNNLVHLLGKADPERALEMARKNVESSPGDPRLLDTLGITLVKQGDLPGGIETLRMANQLAPEDPSISYHLAVALHRDGDRDEAFRVLGLLMESNKVFPEQEEAGALLKWMVETAN